MSFANFIDDAAGHGTYGEPLNYSNSNSAASTSSVSSVSSGNSRENAQHETDHPPDWRSVAAAVVFSVLGVIIMVAVIVIIVGMMHKRR